ncbi:MAG: tryptophan 2,3-dioxygenase [Candidatus Dormibacteraceae bacterium]
MGGSEAGASFGEEGRRLSYGSYLEVSQLLQLQTTLTRAHDELLFIVTHQAYELWFKLLLHELEATRDRIDADDLFTARHHLRRITTVALLLVHQIDVLETMSPQDFLEFRAELAPASGFQSVQFREIEFLCGLKDPAYLARLETTAAERARLQRRLREPSLRDSHRALLERRGSPSLLDVFHDRAAHGDLFDLSEGLLDLDEAIGLWRARHLQMVERQIGAKHGTGGSTGAGYLRTTLDKRFFPELWDVRSGLTTPGAGGH